MEAALIRKFTAHNTLPVRMASMRVTWPGGGKVVEVFSFLVDGLLVDTGLAYLHKPFMQWLAQFPPSQLVLTHHHEDHSGNAAAALKQFGIPGYAHPLAVEKMHSGFSLHPYRLVMFGKPGTCELQPIAPRIETPNYVFDVYKTTGHADDHICLHEPNQGWLFSGDLYLGRRVQVGKKEESIPLQIASLEKLLTLDFDQLYCCHLPRLTQGKTYLREKYDFLVSSRDTILELNRRGLSMGEIRKEMRWPEKWLWRALTLNDVSATHLINSVIQYPQNVLPKLFP